MTFTITANMTVGEKIRVARKAAGLTQQALATRLGITQALVGHYERGIRNPKLATRSRIAEVLGIDVILLFDMADCGSTIRIKESIPTLVSKEALDRLSDPNYTHTLFSFEKNCNDFHKAFDEYLNDNGKLRVMEYAYDLLAQRKYLNPGIEPQNEEELE